MGSSTVLTITDDMRTWADAYVFACRDACAMKGEPFDAEAATAAIREALTTGAKWNPSDDHDFTRDEYDDDPSGEMADRQAAKEWWRATGGDER